MCKSDLKPKIVKKSTFMDNPPFESSGFDEAENCAILPKKIFSTKCMNPIIPGRPKIFIISTLKGGTFFGRFVYNGPGHGFLN